ncbi:MAG: hypothetical protein LQ339_004325 [Xanthoria mediterranea]|nr:MAG: hypothetical protein LQ339_004325 [Xanthoria mediterranea]
MDFFANSPLPIPSETNNHPTTTISITPHMAPSPPPPSITPTPITPLHKRKKQDPTVTESITITVHERVTFTVNQFFTQTDTVFINETVYIHDTITHTSTKPTTVFPSPLNVTLTATSTPTAGKCDPFAASASSVTPFSPNYNKAKGPVIAGAVVGSLLGLALVMGGAWFGVRKWRARKAMRNEHNRGVELQRRWEREQEMRAREGDDV